MGENQEAQVMQQVTHCGYCHNVIRPDRESMINHMFDCPKHPCYKLNSALKRISFVVDGALFSEPDNNDVGALTATLREIKDLVRAARRTL